MTEYLLAALGGVGLGWLVSRIMGRRGVAPEVEQARQAADEATRQLQQEAQASVQSVDAGLRAELAAEEAAQRDAIRGREKDLRTRETTLAERDEALAQRENKLAKREKDLVRKEKRIVKQGEEVDEAVAAARARLEEAAGLSPEEARAILVEEVRDEARKKSLEDIRAIEREARAVADERARMIVAGAIQRYASSHVAERTIANVALPSDDLKGRIIGREGRNIRAFEAATGCDIVVDDTPETVIISCFNPVRREIARLSLIKLLADGRIHPARIEEVVGKTRDEFDVTLRKHGEAAALELEVGGLHPKLLEALGRLNYVTAFAQNVLRHSIEVGFLAGLMAAELGQNVKVARRIGLLHDIGKAADHETEADHAEAGAELCRKFGEKKEIAQVVASHHEGERQSSVLAHIVAAANRLSSSRPGARREALAGYIKRLEELERLAMDFEGVERVYALQAGSEVQVMVDNAKLDDREADLLARDIAQRIEREQAHPGDVTVTVIRHTRAIQYAR